MSEFKVPCGITLGHGESCVADRMCSGCTEVVRLRGELRDLQSTFDLRWKADMRAIKIWQAAHPDKEDVWPDHADLCVWLLGEYEPLKKIGEAAYHLLGVYRPPDFAPGAFKTAWRKLDEAVSEHTR